MHSHLGVSSSPELKGADDTSQSRLCLDASHARAPVSVIG